MLDVGGQVSKILFHIKGQVLRWAVGHYVTLNIRETRHNVRKFVSAVTNQLNIKLCVISIASDVDIYRRYDLEKACKHKWTKVQALTPGEHHMRGRNITLHQRKIFQRRRNETKKEKELKLNVLQNNQQAADVFTFSLCRKIPWKKAKSTVDWSCQWARASEDSYSLLCGLKVLSESIVSDQITEEQYIFKKTDNHAAATLDLHTKVELAHDWLNKLVRFVQRTHVLDL